MKPSPLDFLNQHFIVHTHVEKCGGSTLLHYLTTLIGKENALDLRPFLGKKSLQGYGEIQKKKHGLRLLSGHFRYNSLWTKLISNQRWISQFIPAIINPYGRKKACYVASIRHPIARLDSFFRYLKTRPRHYLYGESIAKNDFEGFVQFLLVKESPLVNNGICAQLTGCAPGRDIFEKAKIAFDHHYLAIVPYDKTYELANVLAKVLCQPTVQEKILNQSTPCEQTKLKEETIERLKEKCDADILLYHYILEHYPAKLIEAEKYLLYLINKNRIK